MSAETLTMPEQTVDAGVFETMSLFDIEFACITEAQSIDWVCDRAASGQGMGGPPSST